MMKEFGKIASGFIGTIFLIVGGITAAGATVNTGTPTYKSMGPICKVGETVFYGELSNSHSEEKLCKLSESEYHFWTKSGNSPEVVGTKVSNVKRTILKGTAGYTIGYSLELGVGDIIKFYGVFNNETSSALAGFFVINDNIIELDPLTIIIK